MTAPGEDFSAALRPELDGRDVARVMFAVTGLSIAIGVSRASVPPGPVLFFAEVVIVWTALNITLIRMRGFTWGDLGWVPVSPGWLAIGAAGSIAIFGLMIAVQLVLFSLFGGGLSFLPQALPLLPRSVAGFLISFILLAVCVPIVEEFLFRGVVYRWMRDRFSLYGALVGSSAIFALAHLIFGAAGGLQIFVIGLALAYLYERSGSLLPSMVLHGVNNGIAISWIYLAVGSNAG